MTTTPQEIVPLLITVNNTPSVPQHHTWKKKETFLLRHLLPNVHYKVYLDYGQTPPFSVCVIFVGSSLYKRTHQFLKFAVNSAYV